jgi:glycerol uptake facilitator-like aquaporin
MTQKIIVEFFGTATLAFAVLASISMTTPILTTPVVAGLVLMLFVYSIGGISGSHLNPAVTVGVWAIKKIPTREAIAYVIAQCLGGFAAFLLAFYLFTGVSVGFTTESYTDFWAELLGMTIFSFGIASVIYKKTNPTASGLVIGGSLTLGILLAVAAGSAGLLNPAVGITLGMVSLSNIAGALFGSIIGMHLYRYLVR